MKTVVWAVVAALLASAVGFFVGAAYQKGQEVQTGRAESATGRNDSAGRDAGIEESANEDGSAFGSVTTGTVVAQSATSITIKTADGGSQTVFVSAGTLYSRQEQLTAEGLRIGDRVLVIPPAAAGGISARSVAVVPPGSVFPPPAPEPGSRTEPAF